jgi:hypothetical protein
MHTLTQSDNSNGKRTKPVRVPIDVWRALRQDAFDRETDLVKVLSEIVRRHYGLNSIEATRKSA